MKNILLFLFAVCAVGFLFYVFLTQVVQPIAFPAMKVPKTSEEVIEQLFHQK